MEEKIKIINLKAEAAANNALSAAEKYVSLFHADIFGRQKRASSSEDDFFSMADDLKRSSEIFFECAEAYLLLESTADAQDLHKKTVLLSEINDLCIEPFLKAVYAEALKETVDVGKIKRSADTFSVKLKNYMIRIL